MSTKVELQRVSTQNNNKADDTADPNDQSATSPIILHFLQEASKLAPSHRGLVDSTFDPYASETTKEPRASSDASDAYQRHGWAQPLSHNGEENRDMYMITTHVGPRLPGSNPWEVMSLINLQSDRSPSESEDRPRGDRGKPKGSSHAAPLYRLTSSGEETSCLTDTTGGSGEASRESLADCPVQRSTTTSAIPSGLSESVRPIPVDQDAVSRSQSAHRAGTGVRWRVIPGSREGPVSADQGAQTEDVRTPTGGVKTRRKQARPTRSADVADPDFQGVMFRMEGQLDRSRGECRLLITSNYRRKLRPRTLSSQTTTSSSDEEPDLLTRVSKCKECASCCTKKTPMWRDAEDGTPLCNACGIRLRYVLFILNGRIS
ncbi:hypothetical protein CRUP_019157 [Coryphaenoides rupestris]|nr:hypothetical protein CRUP_019157 [Coryphaenoides rupestris]